MSYGWHVAAIFVGAALILAAVAWPNRKYLRELNGDREAFQLHVMSALDRAALTRTGGLNLGELCFVTDLHACDVMLACLDLLQAGRVGFDNHRWHTVRDADWRAWETELSEKAQ